MKRTPGILIFDVGKTNKKVIVFDGDYEVIHEESTRLEETVDEDGVACEDIHQLSQWVLRSYQEILSNDRMDIRAVNFSAYGASFVYLDKDQKVILPLYNYLKPYPDSLRQLFYESYGGETEFSMTTASPVLGSLNSGMQLFRIKQEQPSRFREIHHVLHLPQYLSFLITGRLHTEITSVGCHTNLWNYKKNDYHSWVIDQDLKRLFPPIARGNTCIRISPRSRELCAGVGLHDSSAALIPYLSSFRDPFVLMSTGTWSISLNPFADAPLTRTELEQDCLCYLTYEGKMVKASRLFAGHEHEHKVQEIAALYHVTPEWLANLKAEEVSLLMKMESNDQVTANLKKAASAYAAIVKSIVTRQVASTRMVLDDKVGQVFVDGGFSNNNLYLNELAKAFRGKEFYAASIGQASALGAALVMHEHWNAKPVPHDLVKINRFTPAAQGALAGGSGSPRA